MRKFLILCSLLFLTGCTNNLEMNDVMELPNSMKEIQALYLENDVLFVDTYLNLNTTETFYLVQFLEETVIADEAKYVDYFTVTTTEGFIWKVIIDMDSNYINEFKIRRY